MTINFRQFCSDENWRRHLHEPFSFGEFTYATNGHVAIRVPRNDLVSEATEEQQKSAKVLDKFLADRDVSSLTPVAHMKLPDPPESEECERCDGTGKGHDCPDCECECDDCDGKGAYTPERRIRFEHADLQEKYVRLLLGLPGIRLALDEPNAKKPPIPFAFDGGAGLIMPMTRGGLIASDDDQIIDAKSLLSVPKGETEKAGEVAA